MGERGYIKIGQPEFVGQHKEGISLIIQLLRGPLASPLHDRDNSSKRNSPRCLLVIWYLHCSIFVFIYLFTWKVILDEVSSLLSNLCVKNQQLKQMLHQTSQSHLILKICQDVDRTLRQNIKCSILYQCSATDNIKNQTANAMGCFGYRLCQRSDWQPPGKRKHWQPGSRWMERVQDQMTGLLGLQEEGWRNPDQWTSVLTWKETLDWKGLKNN